VVEKSLIERLDVFKSVASINLFDYFVKFEN
jgi:hypothetical protein